MRLELAADYLVMAAWLAYLKSRLLLPPPHDDGEPSGDELAAHLAFQLERLEAMRRVAAQLMGRDQLGRDFFARGMSETVTVKRQTEWTASLSDLLRSYARVKTRDEYRPLGIDRSAIFSMDQALERLKKLMGVAMEWGQLASFLPPSWDSLKSGRRKTSRRSICARPSVRKRPHEHGRMSTGKKASVSAAEALFDAPPLPEQERMVEAILFASAEPLSLAQIGERMPHGSDAGAALARAGVFRWPGSAPAGPCAPHPTWGS
jgi:hypothetical protein